VKLDVEHMVSQMKLQDKKPKQVLQVKLYAIHIFTLNGNLPKKKKNPILLAKNWIQEIQLSTSKTIK